MRKTICFVHLSWLLVVNYSNGDAIHVSGALHVIFIENYFTQSETITEFDWLNKTFKELKRSSFFRAFSRPEIASMLRSNNDVMSFQEKLVWKQTIVTTGCPP